MVFHWRYEVWCFTGGMWYGVSLEVCGMGVSLEVCGMGVSLEVCGMGV